MGWNPDGQTTNFEINEPAVFDDEWNYVSVIAKAFPNDGIDRQCVSLDILPGFGFSVTCASAPPENS